MVVIAGAGLVPPRGSAPPLDQERWEPIKEKTEIKAVELVRSIRDQQAELLVGKSNDEIIEFFRLAGEAAVAFGGHDREPLERMMKGEGE